MKYLFITLMLVSSVVFAAAPIVEKETATIYVLKNPHGRTLITNMVPFPRGYVIVSKFKQEQTK